MGREHRQATGSCWSSALFLSKLSREMSSALISSIPCAVCAEDDILLLLQATGLSTYPLWKAAAQSSPCLTLPPPWHSVTWCQGFSTTSASMLWKKTRRALLSSSSRKPLGCHAQVMLIFWVSVTEMSVASPVSASVNSVMVLCVWVLSFTGIEVL